MGGKPRRIVFTLLSLGTWLLSGFLTVATETFTHLLTTTSWRKALLDMLLQAFIFLLTGCLWALSVWVSLWLVGASINLTTCLELLGLAHFPLLVYPLTITPTLGYRLEQILRVSVYVVYAGLLIFTPQISPVTAGMVCLPGWALHFLTLEWRLLRRAQEPR